MNNYKWSLLLTLSIITIFGCQKLLPPEDVPVSDPLDLAALFESNTFLTVASFGQGYDRYAGILTQHMGGHEAIAADLACYQLDPELFNVEFNHIYLEAFGNLKTIMEAAREQDAWNYLAVAQILTAQNLGYLTDIYGAIPWTQALQQVHDTPKYDSQEIIYLEIQRLLSEAIEHLDKTSSIPLESNDLFYDGDLVKWKITAHILQARYHNHLSKRYPSQSAADALAAIEKARDLGLSADSDLYFPYDGTNFINPWNEREAQDLPISNVLIDLMKGKQDPRLESYFKLATTGTYQGYPIHCYATGTAGVSTLNPEGFFGKADAPLLLASHFEALFIEAEAAYRAGNLLRAASALNEAVEASIEKVVSNSAALNESIQKYISNYASETPSTISMERIMTEKYVALFTKNIESWVDLRRHDYLYPNFLQIPQSEVGVQVHEHFIRRVPYPRTELEMNPEYVPNVTLFEPLWWDE